MSKEFRKMNLGKIQKKKKITTGYCTKIQTKGIKILLSVIK